MKFKAVAFDMDGVLVDTEKIYRKCWLKNGLSIGIPEAEMEQICDRLAGGTKKTNAHVLKERMGADFDYLAFRKRTIEMFENEIREHGIEVKHGVVETLRTLKDMGIKMAVATSTDRDRAEDKLIRSGLLPYFDEVICGDEIEKGKPYPDIYLKACEKLGTQPEETIGVEDSINGVTASNRAGLYTVMVIDLISPDENTKKLADEIYTDIFEIINLF